MLKVLKPGFEKTKGFPAPPDPDSGILPSKALDAGPDAIGAWMLDRCSDQIAIVGAGRRGATGWHARRGMWGEPCAFLLDKRSGRWRREPEPWRTLLQTTLREVSEYIRSCWPDDYITPALRTLNSVKRDKRLVDGVRLQLKAVVEDRRSSDPDAWPNLTMCTVDQLDKNLRYLGAENGIIDLKTGDLLRPEEGKTKIVTYSVGIPYDPEAKHQLVEMLLDHLGDTRGWWLAVLAHAAWGQPGRRFYFVHGPTGAGKTTMMEAIVGTFGEYASRPPDNVLQVSKMPQQSAATPGLDQLAHPYRIAMFDDMSGGISPTLLKQVCGGGSIAFRRTYEEPQTQRATATPFIVCNPGDEPSLAAQDPAVRARLRVLNYPPVEKAIGDLPERIRTEGFRMAMLATIVREAGNVTPGTPPDNVPSVEEATSVLVEQDIGPIGTFVKRLQPGSGNIAFAAVWKAWCDLFGEAVDARSAGGIGKRSFAKRLRALEPRLHPPKGVRVDGRTVHGWRGWELLDASDVPEDPAPGAVEPLPKNATPQQALAANDRVKEEGSRIRAQFRKAWEWRPEWIEGPGAALGEREVLAEKRFTEDGKKNVRRVEPQWWPDANVERAVYLEARYLQMLVLNWRNGTLKATKNSPGPVGLERRVESFLRWCSYGADMLETIKSLAIEGVYVHPSLRDGPPASEGIGAPEPASDSTEEEEIPAWTSQLVEVLGSQNHGPQRCFERVTVFARQVFPPPREWAVYDETTPHAEDVPETEPHENDSHPLPEIDLVEGEAYGLPQAEPMAVGSSAREALQTAAELRAAELRAAQGKEPLYWVLVGG